jgi:hypothetical protein
MNAITDKYNWNAHKTTDIDRRTAKNLMRALRSKDYDYPEAKIELQKEIRRLLGFSIPEECLFIIKEYLLLPRDVFKGAYNFRYIQLPAYRVLTIAEEEGLLVASTYDKQVEFSLFPPPNPVVFNRAKQMVVKAINLKPVSERARLYNVFNEYGKRYYEEYTDLCETKRDYSVYVKSTIKSEHTRWIKTYDTIPIRNKIDFPKEYPNPKKYTFKHRHADMVNTITRAFPAVVEHAIHEYSRTRYDEELAADELNRNREVIVNREYIGALKDAIYDKIHIEERVFCNIIRCYDGTMAYIDKIDKECYFLPYSFRESLREGLRVPNLREDIRRSNLGHRSARC